ncbi:MAG TPA: hypothetical protein VFX00_01910 [Pedococcus sp.]|jgi:uncharacterized protein with LGFP repeats|nr:hypothetical protein [Pedococcus sp.]
MSTLEDLNARPGGLVGMIDSLSRRFRPLSRRSMLVGAAVAGSALATNPRTYALRPVTAYASICGPGSTFDSGWTVFCCTINKGVNACPPGSFAAGWWKAADSSWCGNGYRYIVDCNASCSKCSTGCSDGICDSRCWSCSCGRGSSATCDQRRVCCNAFRYGQCNTQVKCSGGVHCRVVSCVAPYKWASCTTTSLSDNRTAEHSAPCLPNWGAIQRKYDSMGAAKSWLGASIGPERAIGDGHGRFVTYQHGWIVWSHGTGARNMHPWAHTPWVAEGAYKGVLGYPVSDMTYGLKDSAWMQIFQGGAITDSLHTRTESVTGVRWTIWRNNGRENGVLGFPTSGLVYGPGQYYWIQTFQGGAITDSRETTTQMVAGVMWDGWKRAGRENGVLSYPSTPRKAVSRGAMQGFRKGELWALGSGKAYRVYGSVLTEWRAAGGAAGRYGFPLSDTVVSGDGLSCTFEHGTITVGPRSQAAWSPEVFPRERIRGRGTDEA